jgi:hypothetical protein
MPLWAWVLLFTVGPVILCLAAIGASFVYVIWAGFKGQTW